MERIWVTVFLLWLTQVSTCQAQNENYLVCKPISNLFDGNNSSTEPAERTVPVRGPPGRPGKRGHQGSIGPAGPIGPQPKIDWRVVDERIDTKIEARLNCSGFVDRGYCYRLLYTTANRRPHKGGKQGAISMCSFHGGELVDIDTKELYDKIYKYVQQAWMGYLDEVLDYVDIWLASVCQGGKARSSTGGKLYVEWYPNHPVPVREGLTMAVATRPTRTAVGYWNVAPNSGQPVPFCRFKT